MPKKVAKRKAATASEEDSAPPAKVFVVIMFDCVITLKKGVEER